MLTVFQTLFYEIYLYHRLWGRCYTLFLTETTEAQSTSEFAHQLGHSEKESRTQQRSLARSQLAFEMVPEARVCPPSCPQHLEPPSIKGHGDPVLEGKCLLNWGHPHLWGLRDLKLPLETEEMVPLPTHFCSLAGK